MRAAIVAGVCLLWVALACGCQGEGSQGETVGGAKQGPWVIWHPSGQRKLAGDYDSGKQHGKWTEWYPSGQRKEAGTYINGQKDGAWIAWYENGQIKGKGSYDKGTKSTNWIEWEAGGEKLESEGPPVAANNIMLLIGDLKGRNDAMAAEARTELASMGSVAVPALVDLLRGEENPLTRLRAVQVLNDLGKNMGSETPRTLPVLIECLGDNTQISNVAAQTLVVLGPETSLTPLIAALGNKSSQVRTIAAIAIGDFKAEGKPAIGPLVLLLQDATTRTHAADALAAIGPEAVPALHAALGDSNTNVRRVAAKALGGIGPPAAVATPDLVRMLGDSGARDAAIVALGKIGDSTVPALIAAIKDSSHVSKTRDGAAETLGKIGEPAIKPLIPLLESTDSDVRFRAAVALGNMGPKARQSLSALQAAKARESDSGVEFYLTTAIKNIDK